MLRFLLRRVLLVVPTFLGVTLLAFLLIHLVPGDPVQVNAGQHPPSPELYAELLHRYGLDLPLWRQFLRYLAHVLQGDLGESLVTHGSVWQEFLTHFPATAELGLGAMLFAVVLGLPLGILAAIRRGTVVDYGLMSVAVAGASMPIFWWGLILILVFSVGLGWTPVSGRMSDLFDVPTWSGLMLVDTWWSEDDGAFASAVEHLILPVVVLGTIPLATVARMTRSAMLEVLGEDYVRTARAKGLSGTRVVVVHALRNALIPVVTVIGLQTGTLLGGAILTETIFSWPGLGQWLVESVLRRDYPVVQGAVLLIATIVILVNLTVDVTYGWLNPRVRG